MTSYIVLFILVFVAMILLFNGRGDPRLQRRHYYRRNRFNSVEDYIPQSYYDEDEDPYSRAYYEDRTQHQGHYPTDHYYPQSYQHDHYRQYPAQNPYAYGPPPTPYFPPYPGYPGYPGAYPPVYPQPTHPNSSLNVVLGVALLLIGLGGAYALLKKDSSSGTIINIHVRPEDLPQLEQQLRQDNPKSTIQLDQDMPERRLTPTGSENKQGNGSNIYSDTEKLEIEQDLAPVPQHQDNARVGHNYALRLLGDFQEFNAASIFQRLYPNRFFEIVEMDQQYYPCILFNNSLSEAKEELQDLMGNHKTELGKRGVTKLDIVDLNDYCSKMKSQGDYWSCGN